MPSRKNLYLAVDIGGTKILAALVDASGKVLSRQKCPTPRDKGPEPLFEALDATISKMLAENGNLKPRELRAMGIAVPGVVDPDEGLVIVTPNMGLSNTRLGDHCAKMFSMPVAIGNDCNTGILGEKWLGAARRARSAMGILVGTGIGGGFIQGSRVWRGAREAASEIGHIVMEINGPPCGCGNRGCLEALASRTAIERRLREAMAAGRPTILSQLLDDETHVIRSNVLRQAIEAGDPLVAEVLGFAADVIGHACLTVGHLLDPEVIVLGGGVIEACSHFMVPLIEGVVKSDCLIQATDGGGILVSSLGDDAVILGAAALARQCVGEDPFKRRFAVAPSYRPIARRKSGGFQVNSKSFDSDFIVTASGKAKPKKVEPPRPSHDGRRHVQRWHLARACRGGPHVLFIAAGPAGDIELSDDAQTYLKQRLIDWQIAPLDEAIEAYNASNERKAALVFMT
ncbi:MAG TPA: hypothetical protein DD670_19875 [Planctomycetaceae bacterium]|nr:hypothetical protein [Planctomycetaceae bacterium]